ncbi:trypsin-like peptidase domain-containing protein [Stieleria varia]|uniref:Thioredoxin n=1 Tax=Stieleria varia TaxID=2528005 RepID=A0A5C6B8H0_9BACT|nr:trypsin-like peptidase domain-containing protein [Stieleria varia]TWU07589.1 Thioredoxin [Stieleria varia]
MNALKFTQAAVSGSSTAQKVFRVGMAHVATAAVALLAMLTTLLSSQTAEAQIAGAVLVEFSADQCLSCRAMEPVIAQLENSGVPVRRINVAQEPDVARRYSIAQTPTFVVISGGREIARLVGPQSLPQLQNALRTSTRGPLVQTNSTIAQPPQTRLVASGSAAAPTQLVNETANTSLSPAGNFPASEPMPSVSIAQAVQVAQAATVRLKVHDGRGYGAGTGTIIDTHGEEALVMTCGHLFRETKGQGKIDVELFVGGQVKTVPGTVVDYDSENRDIALVAIRPGFAVQSVKVIGAGEVPQTGQSVFSFGCDHGDDPSRRDTRIIAVDKYNQEVGASNLEIAGAPVDGRSGGGLFDAAGRLIGVCNAADYKSDTGFYTGPGSIHWQLDRINLSHLYQGQPSAAGVNPAMVAANNAQQPPPALAMAPTTPMAGAVQPRASMDPSIMRASATAPIGSREVIVIVRDPNHPEDSQVMTIRQPTAELMHMLQSHAR